MASIGRALRRTLFFVVLAATVGAAVSWRRSRSTPTPSEPPQWPAWTPQPSQPPSAGPTPGVPEQLWLPANDDGSMPDGHPIKAKETSGIYHVPGGRFYDRTKPDRCYPTADAAEADGYRRAKA